MKMILSIILIVASCLTVSFSRAGRDLLAREIFRIKPAASGEVQWALHQNYRHTKLQYNGIDMNAYYSNPEDLLGFGKNLSVIDLPPVVTRKINRRFRHCNISGVMLFIDAGGRVYYYAGIKQYNKITAVKISSTCQVDILQKITLN